MKQKVYRLLSAVAGICLLLGLLACTKKQSKPDFTPTSEPVVRSVESFNRTETVYIAGSLKKTPRNWNPLMPHAVIPGISGLIYETLFNWDPITDRLTPYLAKWGMWIGQNTYQLVLRRNLTWQDSQELSVEDVKYTFELAKQNPEIYYSSLWDWLDTIVQSNENTLIFTFKEARYQEWLIHLTQIAILPKHIFSLKSKEELLSGTNAAPLGSGPYAYENFQSDRMIFVKNASWWGVRELRMEPKPKRVVLLNIPSYNVALGLLMKGYLDLSTFFLPDIASIKNGYGIKTWFQKEPFNVPYNANLLWFNCDKKPLDDVLVRRAIASSVNVNRIIEDVYDNMVEKSHPLGLVKGFKDYLKYNDEELAKKLTQTYDPAKAKALLQKAGLYDVDTDGLLETGDSIEISLTIAVPSESADLVLASRIIAENITAVGLSCESKSYDCAQWEENTYHGNFDLMIHNYRTGPHASLAYLLKSIIQEPDYAGQATHGNYGRYESTVLKQLYSEFILTRPDDVVNGKKIISSFMTKLVEEVPVVSLWNNGLWYQSSDSVWGGWPDEINPYGFTDANTGMWGQGIVKVLCTIDTKQVYAKK